MEAEALPIIEVKGISKTFSYGKKLLYALTDIHLSLNYGKTLGIVGESGCGKSTLGKIILGLEIPSAGEVFFQGKNIHKSSKKDSQKLRQQMQVVFQDPYAALNPYFHIEDCIGEGIDIHKLCTKNERRERIASLLNQVGLNPALMRRYPHELSGGQRQRIAIARALAVNPLFLMCDEPLSALDACTQKQIMELFIRLKQEIKMTYLFISHDLKAIQKLADQVAVMYLGKIIEYGPTQQIFNSPQHPYTQALLSAIPEMDTELKKNRPQIILKGDLPSPLSPPSGCSFHTRCPKSAPLCQNEIPQYIQLGKEYAAACHLLPNESLQKQYTELHNSPQSQ
jgi:oligopeptide transport system ATP-binding protein